MRNRAIDIRAPRRRLWTGAASLAVALVSAQAAWAQSTAPDPAQTRIEQRLSNLDHDKLEALLSNIGAAAPPNLYGCLCRAMPHVSNVGVAFNSKTGKCHFAGFGEWELPIYSAPEVWRGCIASQRYPDGRSLVDVIAGAVADLHAKQAANAGSKTPTTSSVAIDPNDPYSAERIRLYTDLRMRGFPMNKIEALDAMIRKRIMGLDQPGELPTFLQALGISKPPAGGAASLDQWRRSMLDHYNQTFMGWMRDGKPNKIASGLYGYSRALGNYDAAMKTASEAAIDEIAANQKFVESGLQAIPPAAIALDAIAAANWLTGNKDIGLTGEAVTGVDLFIRFAGYAAPEAVVQLMKRSPTARLIAEGIAEMGADFGARAKGIVSGMLKGEEGELSKGVQAIDEIVAGERRALSKSTNEIVDKAMSKFEQSAAGQADKAMTQAEIDASRTALQDMGKLKPGSPEWNQAVIAFQTNKTAQRLVNGKEFDDALRSQINRTTERWYKAADASTAQDLKALLKAKSDEVPEIAKKFGMSDEAARNFRADAQRFAKRNKVAAEELDIGAKTITNKRPGADTTVSVGRDRDVTFEIRTKSGVTQDIDHVVSEGPYFKGFKQATGVSDAVVEKAGGLTKWAHEDMDQSVTSKWANEAYNPGEVKLDDYLDKGRAPTMTRVEDVRDTIVHKSNEWFERAEQAGRDPALAARDTVEGMRQATKQWNDLILSREPIWGEPRHGCSPAPCGGDGHIQAGLEGRNQRREGQGRFGRVIVSSRRQNRALRQVKGRRRYGRLLRIFGEGSGQGIPSRARRRSRGGRQDHRRGQSRELAGFALIALNDALRNGRIEGERFVTLRSQVLSLVVKGLSADAFATWARSANARGLINAAEMAAGAR